MSLTKLMAMRQAWGEQEMHFADPELSRVMNEKFGKLTLAKATSIVNLPHVDFTPLNNILTGNDKVKSFEEIKYFTGLQRIFYLCDNCPNLGGTMTIPESVMEVGGRCFFNTQLIGIEFLAQNFKWGHGAIWRCTKLKWVKMYSVEVPQKIQANNQYLFDFAITNNEWKLYVPDGSVDKYRTDHNFANLGDRIRPMSEFKE